MGKIKKTIRLDDKSDMKMKELQEIVGAKSENEVVEYAIQQLYERHKSEDSFLKSYDKAEELLSNSFSLLLKTHTEEIANMLNQINYNNKVTLIMLEMILQATSAIPENVEVAKKVIMSNLKFRTLAEDVLEELQNG